MRVIQNASNENPMAMIFPKCGHIVSVLHIIYFEWWISVWEGNTSKIKMNCD